MLLITQKKAEKLTGKLYDKYCNIRKCFQKISSTSEPTTLSDKQSSLSSNTNKGNIYFYPINIFLK